jgi:hypothetical protein
MRTMLILVAVVAGFTLSCGGTESSPPPAHCPTGYLYCAGSGKCCPAGYPYNCPVVGTCFSYLPTPTQCGGDYYYFCQ